MQQIFSHIDSVGIRFGYQIVSFLMTLIVTHMVWREYVRHRTSFHKHLTVSFSLLFVQSLYMLGVFLHTILSGSRLPETVMPMADHLLKIAGFIVLAHAFTVVAPIDSRQAKRLYVGNLLLLLLTAPVFWQLWRNYLHDAPAAEGRFGYYWIDSFYELWGAGLLLYGLQLVLKSEIKVKGIFTSAFLILLAKQSLHLVNGYLASNTIAPLLTIERLLQIPFFYVIIMAIHQEIVGEVEQLNHENEHLDRKLYDSVIQALVGSLEIKDPYTEGHAKRVTDYAVQIGRKMKLGEEELRNLYLGAILHDVGKIGTQFQVLNKRGELNADERRLIKRHTADGPSLVSAIDNLKHIVPTIRYHHERWDGTGYPDGLAGDRIPLDARIVAVADAFDAMTTDRCYRQALCMEDAVSELSAGRGKQFDPQVVDLFISILQHPEYNTFSSRAA